MSDANLPAEAMPRAPAEAAGLAPQSELPGLAVSYGITQIVHFTTVLGAVGVICSGAVKTRSTLPHDKLVEFVYRPNAVNSQRDKDRPWHDYVNLSISEINGAMFGHSTRWHASEGVSWVCLSFSPLILSTPGMVFTTTNNTYSGCLRAEGSAGFRRLFGPTVTRWPGNVATRGDRQPHLPTDQQAEVLHPGELPLDHLQRIDVQIESALDDINGALGAMNMAVDVALAPEVFV